ncbi:MAG TPA: hypothetical protein PKE26_03540 [Kiritimatiellia bacterium]|nr:hypothetical protein [Kiritimatiellia bacterium]HMO98163.1 hypothetical protein [Kiritimatiellia bacterium]HMP96675.1 hypothetical protein [Kiritimatiellia bacterium]
MSRLGHLVLVLLLGGGLAAMAQKPSSANYALASYAFTSGKANAGPAPSSPNYRLAAANLGDLSRTPLASVNYRHYPGYLGPWGAEAGAPNLVRFIYSGGRLWLFWNAVGNASSYTVEHAAGPSNFVALAAGVTTNRHDLDAPVATSRLYRIRVIRSP